MKMLRKPLFWEVFGMTLLVGGLNWWATKNNIYWSVREFDSLMHFLGGALVSLGFVWLYFFSGRFSPTKRRFRDFFVIAILGVTLVSVLWEIYELVLGETEIQGPEYPYDTTLDFIMDFLGGSVACFYAFLREPEENTKNAQ
jgi:hypothetical protein